MELIKYLNENFYTRQELIDVAKVSKSTFLTLQAKGVMPACSYKININLSSTSFTGEFSKTQELEYYAKGYASWLGILQSVNDSKEIFSIFSERYSQQLLNLRNRGVFTNNPKVNSGLALHIKEEWTHFIEGTYGLCTKSGLPEDIATKELAVFKINELTSIEELNEDQLAELRIAVDLLDGASAMFAPHERINSSRNRLVNEVRRKYKL